MKKLIISIPILLLSGFLILNFINIFISPAFLFAEKTPGGREPEAASSGADGGVHGFRPVRQYAACGTYLEPWEFIADITSASAITVKYKTEPDFSKPGLQSAVVSFIDSNGNNADIASSIYLYDITKTLEIEAGTVPSPIYPRDFIKNYIQNDLISMEFDMDVNALDFSKPCAYDIGIFIAGRETRAKINVADTTPPEASVQPFKCALNNRVPADKFIADIVDATNVTASYKTPPDFSRLGVQSVVIVLTDEAGNSASRYTVLTVMEDTEPPVILGETDKFVKAGSSVIYRANVTVTDNCDDTVKLNVDSSAVNLQKPGIYPVIYSAGDFSGNYAVVEGSLTVMEADMNEVLEMADEILAQIIKEDMTPEQQVRAVYNWIVFHVSYKNVDEKNSLVVGGYNAFKLGRGDCYTFYAAAEILLTKLGIDNIPITRLGGRTMHYWRLVNIGDGWYHFDACPRSVYFDGCMFTDTQAENFSAEYGKYYYNYDKSLYPEVVK